MVSLRTDTDRLPGEGRRADVDRYFAIELERYQQQFRGAKAIYVSVPITTGVRYFDALRRRRQFAPPFELKYEVIEREVIHPNVVAAREFISTIGDSNAIIDPTAVFVPGASQSDYYRFWQRVLAHVVARLVAGPAWCFSFGCLTEIASALLYGVPVFIDGERVYAADIEALIERADRHLASLEFSTPLLVPFWVDTKRSLACSTSMTE